MAWKITVALAHAIDHYNHCETKLLLENRNMIIEIWLLKHLQFWMIKGEKKCLIKSSVNIKALLNMESLIPTYMAAFYFNSPSPSCSSLVILHWIGLPTDPSPCLHVVLPLLVNHSELLEAKHVRRQAERKASHWTMCTVRFCRR